MQMLETKLTSTLDLLLTGDKSCDKFMRLDESSLKRLGRDETFREKVWF
jgi:hypothetical protein